MKPRAISSSSSSYFGLGLSLALLGFLGFLAAAGAATFLASFAGTVLLLMLGLRLWGRLGLLRLEVELSCGAERLFPGEEFELRAEIRNRKALPVWIRLELGRAEAPSPVLRGGVEAEGGLRPFERREGAWAFRAERRGVQSLGPARIMAGDPLGLFRRGRELGFRRDIVVFPRRRAIRGLELPFRDFFGIHPAKGIIEDPAWYEGTREYAGNKPAKNIHWKASARLGVLQEKIFEPTSHKQVFFLLDGEEFEAEQDAEGFETALELLGALAARFAEEGASFALATDRFVRDFPAILPLGRGPEQLGRVLELLARCEPRRGRSILSLLGDLGSAGAGFVVVSRSPGRAMEKFLSLPAARRERVLFIFADAPGGEEAIVGPSLGFGELLEGMGGGE